MQIQNTYSTAIYNLSYSLQTCSVEILLKFTIFKEFVLDHVVIKFIPCDKMIIFPIMFSRFFCTTCICRRRKQEMILILSLTDMLLVKEPTKLILLFISLSLSLHTHTHWLFQAWGLWTCWGTTVLVLKCFTPPMFNRNIGCDACAAIIGGHPVS